MIGSFPLAASIVTIFAFAGIHNFMEFRYFAARMPLRWGRSRLYYSVGIGGVIVLAAAYLTLYFASGNWLWSVDNWASRGRPGIRHLSYGSDCSSICEENSGRKATGHGPFPPRSCSPLSPGWCRSTGASPSFTFTRSSRCGFSNAKSAAQNPNGCVRIIFALRRYLFLSGLWLFHCQTAESVRGDKPLLADHAARGQRDITRHFEPLSGCDPRISRIDPLFCMDIADPARRPQGHPVEDERIPLFANRRIPKAGRRGNLLSLILVVFWAGFSVDYTTTRDIYFAFAIAHVLAEFPFLIKML